MFLQDFQILILIDKCELSLILSILSRAICKRFILQRCHQFVLKIDLKMEVTCKNYGKYKINSCYKSFVIDPNEDKMLADGLSRFCEDIRLDPASFEVLLICWKFKAAIQCEFTRKEFTDGMTELWYVRPGFLNNFLLWSHKVSGHIIIYLIFPDIHRFLSVFIC